MNTQPQMKMKQAYSLFMLAIFSPSVRLASGLCAKLGGRAGWVSIILSCLIYFALLFLLSCFFKAKQNDLFDIYQTALGKTGGKALSSVYLIWIFVLICLYVRTFAERFTSSILPSSPTSFFIISILILCYIFLSGQINHFIRLSNIFFYIVVFCLVLIFFMQMHKIKAENFLPVTTLDSLSILKGTYPFLGVFCYITFLLFAGDYIDEKEKLFVLGKKSVFILLAANQIVFFTTVGIFGNKLTQNLTLPFFMSVKTINLFNSLERLESLFLILWVITDIAVIMMLLIVFLRLSSKIFNLENTLILKTPLFLGIYLFSMYFVKNTFEISEFSEKIALALNLVLGIAVPIVIFFVWKIKMNLIKRKKISELLEIEKKKYKY